MINVEQFSSYNYSNFSWTKDNSIAVNDSRRTFGYPFLMFKQIFPSDSGNYIVTVTGLNYTLATSELLMFTLDVLCE